MVELLRQGKREEAEEKMNAAKPLFAIVTVKTQEETPHGLVSCRARNPLATKTLMNILGMPAGPCRPPLGKMTKAGIEVALNAARTVWKSNPEVLTPIADFFNVDIEARLYDESLIEGLTYSDY
jgi:4-hydroxy-tetrahydrodipicolinate synthase